MEALGQCMVSCDTTNPAPPGHGAAQPPAFPSVMAQTLDMGLTLCPELSIEAEHSTLLQEVEASLQKNPELIFAHPDQVNTRHSNLTPIMVQLLDLECSMTPPSSTGTKLLSVMWETPGRLQCHVQNL